jgi:hypothetical protein
MSGDLVSVLSTIWETAKKSIETSIMEALAGTYTVNTFIEIAFDGLMPMWYYDRREFEITTYVKLSVDVTGFEKPNYLLLSDEYYRLYYAVRFAHEGIFNMIFPDYLEQQLRLFGNPDYAGPKYVNIDNRRLVIEPEGEGAIVVRSTAGIIVIDTEYSLLLYHKLKTAANPTYFYQFTISVNNVEVRDDYPEWYIEVET